MQLDRTQIEIRERSMGEIMDLSLHVLVRYGGRILFWMGVLAAPLMLLNWLLIGFMAEPSYTRGNYAQYFWVMGVLVFLQAPFASSLAVLYLGPVLFDERPSAGRILKDFAGMFPRLAWSQFFRRGILAAWLLTLGIPRNPLTYERGSFFPWAEFFLVILVVSVVFLRSFRTYVLEIILLERNPLAAKRPGDITVSSRSANLHSFHSGDLFARWLASMCAAFGLWVSVFFTMWFMSGILFLDWDWGPGMMHVAAPLAMWLVAGYFTVVRFLSYLDLRIRLEGWEVELRMRAERARLERQLG